LGDIDALTGLELIAGEKRQISGYDIEGVIGGKSQDHDFYGNLFPWLLKALFGTNDLRAAPLAIRLASDFAFRSCWELAFQLLATKQCQEVEDFFVRFLCADNQPSRPELEMIVDEYFRRNETP